MTFESFLGPAIIAAVVSGAISLVSLWVNRSTSLKTHREKLEFDKSIAERKFEAERQLSENKLNLDRRLEDWKRKSALGEQVLADFYKAKDIFADARMPFSSGNDGATRPGSGDGEDDNLKRLRDSMYVPYERLMKERTFFGEMQSRRYRFMALFGEEAGEPFLAFMRSFNEIGTATGILIRSRERMKESLLDKMESRIGWGDPKDDEIADRLNAAVKRVEALVAPSLKNIPH